MNVKKYCFIDENGHMQGEYRDYHKNGQLWERSFYRDGERHGECKLYEPNGVLRLHCYYHMGKHHGEYIFYNLKGEKITHTFFCNGKRHGVYLEYYDNELSRKTYYHNGVDHKVDPDILTERDKVYIEMSGRLPPRLVIC